VLARAVYYHYKRLRVNLPKDQEKHENASSMSASYEQRLKSMRSPKGWITTTNYIC